MEIPRHIALTPDGNRRWAKERGLKPWEGHKAGIERFKEFLDWCYDAGVEEITAYSLSKENLDKRTPEEVKFLFKLYAEGFRELLESAKVIQREVKVEFAGDLEPFPKELKGLIDEVHEKTGHFKKRKLTLCMNYSGRGELLGALKKLVESGKPINEENLEEFLQIRSPPDMMIRTAEKRISNFLLWQCAYSEIYFSPKMFPDFTHDDFMDALKEFKDTERRYGK
jgi:undecaprenyl diphosphate synthase